MRDCNFVPLATQAAATVGCKQITVFTGRVMNTSSLCIDDQFSTTRIVVASPDKFEATKAMEGGLRTKGYKKHSWPDKPIITVIVVVFNRVDTLEDCILSVIRQRYDNVELIIIDGGSTDGTLDIIRNYDQYIDYWLSEKDDGIYFAMNKGIELGSGDWLYFLGSDDVMLDSIHKVAKHLRSENTIYYGDVYLPESHAIAYNKFTPYKLMKMNIPHQATFYPKVVFRKYKYNLQYISAADYDLNIRCYNDRDLKYDYIPILVAIYDESGFSTLRLDNKFAEDFFQVLKENFTPGQYYMYRCRMAKKNFKKTVKTVFRNLIQGKKQTLTKSGV